MNPSSRVCKSAHFTSIDELFRKEPLEEVSLTTEEKVEKILNDFREALGIDEAENLIEDCRSFGMTGELLEVAYYQLCAGSADAFSDEFYNEGLKLRSSAEHILYPERKADEL